MDNTSVSSTDSTSSVDSQKVRKTRVPVKPLLRRSTNAVFTRQPITAELNWIDYLMTS